jgi:hypothetical protein
MFGLYPIPDTDGDTITFDSEYGAVVQWVCPVYTFNQEYGVLVRMTDTDEFLLNTDSGVVGQVYAMNHNIWIEYYRLPEKLMTSTIVTTENGSQYPEIPREYQLSLPDWAAGDLLENNPEDSAEFKRSVSLKAGFYEQINTFIGKRKKPIAGLNLQARPHVWNWQKNMPYRNQMP